MSAGRRQAASGYLRYLAWAVAATAAVALLGYVPTRRLAGEDGVPAMLAGCAVALLACALGSVPIALADRRDSAPAARLQAVLAAMALRFALVLALGVAVALSGWFERRPLLLWLAIGYMVQLVVEARYALRSMGGGNHGRDVETR